MATATARAFRVTPFRPEDYLAVIAEILVEPLPERLLVDRGRESETFATAGPAWTGWCKERAVACAGVMLPWPGYGVAWALVTRWARDEAGMDIHRAVVRGLRDVIRTHALRRVEANVDASFGLGRRWVTALGFTEESVMPHYGPEGQTFVKYVLCPLGHAR